MKSKAAKIALVKKKGKKYRGRSLISQRKGNARRAFRDWNTDDLKEKMSGMAIRMLAANEIAAERGTPILTPDMVSRLQIIAQSFLPMTVHGMKLRRIPKEYE